MSHTLGIVGHVDRVDMVQALAEQVRPEVMSIDDGSLSCDGNHRRVWSTLLAEYPHSRWTVVLEDDAVPVPDFHVQLEAALKKAPALIVSLYLGRDRPRDAQAAIRSVRHSDTSWLVGSRLLHAVGIAVRTPLVGPMLSGISAMYPIDEAISRWAKAQRHRIAYTWPSLVNHADTPSVMDYHPDEEPRGPITELPDGRVRLTRRVAWRCGTREQWDTSTTLVAL